MKKMSKLMYLLFSTLMWKFSAGQLITFHAGPSMMITTEQTTYSSKLALGGGFSARVKPLDWLYIQGGLHLHQFVIFDERIKNYKVTTWDWQVGFIPYQKIPIHVFIGTLQHRYRFRSKSISGYGMVLVPEIDQTRIWDGWNIGIAYPIKKWLEVSVIYEKEPFYLFKDPHTSNYLRFGVSLNSSLLSIE